MTATSELLHGRYCPMISQLYGDVVSYDQVAEIPASAAALEFRREKKSHRGIRELKGLKALKAEAVDQDFLEELCQIEELEYLSLGWPTTAKDLSPLARLENLWFLRIDSPRNITNFTPVLKLPRLRNLFIENAKHLSALDWLRPLAGQIKVLGIEGSMYTKQKIESLRPLAEFDLEALFLSSTHIADQDLSPLHGLSGLRYLNTAINAPRSEFEALKRVLPDLYCTWFDPENWKEFRGPPKPK